MALLRSDNKLRLGGPVFAESRDPQFLVDYHLGHGFAAAYDPGVEDPGQLAEIKAAYKEADIIIAETGAFVINMLDPDEQVREANIDRLCRRLERAELVGALCCVAHGGTPNSRFMMAHNPRTLVKQPLMALSRRLSGSLIWSNRKPPSLS